MRKFIFLFLFSIITVYAIGDNNLSAGSLYKPNSPVLDNSGKWYFGGNIGANFWNDYLLLSVEPMAGYNFNSKFSLGFKAHYSFIKEDNDNIRDFTYHNFGGSIFARYSPIPLGYLHAEFAYNNYEQYSYNSISQDYNSERVWVPFLLLGAGYRQPIGPNASVYGEVLFDVLQDKNSPFEKWEPIVHVGAAVGF